MCVMCICALTRLAAVVNVSRAFREEVRFESAAAHCIIYALATSAWGGSCACVSVCICNAIDYCMSMQILIYVY